MLSLPELLYPGQLGPIIEQNIPSIQCLAATLSYKTNFLNITCKDSVDPNLVDAYLLCVSLLITLDLKTINLTVTCPDLNINDVSSMFKNCEWCRGKYGCFQVGGPFISIPHPISFPPQPESCLGLIIQLYTRSNKDIPFNFTPDDVSKINRSHFNSSENSMFLIGGLQNGDSLPSKIFIDIILSGTNTNVFIFNWAKGSGDLYEQVIANARLLGAMLAYFINLLKEKVNYSPSKVHLIGISTGAQLAGYAGEKVTDLGRITGLDPAGPYFHCADERVRLDPSDAKFVDVIHTNSGGLGTIQNVGHLDFRPNGGTLQNGCDPFSRISDPVLLSALVCEHAKSAFFFANSMPRSNPNYNCTFKAHQCSSYLDYKGGKCKDCGANDSKCARMGYYAKDYVLAGNPIPVNDSFYLTTTDQAPYCVDHTP